MKQAPRPLLILGILSGLVLFCALPAPAQSDVRSWTSADGSYQTQAEFLEFKDQKVHLRRADDREIAVPLSKLSAADREYVRLEVQRRRKAAAAEAPAKTTAKTAVPGGAGEWPRFRGPNVDGKSAETGLLKEWPAEGPPLLWQAEGLGTGFASGTLAGGKIFTMGRLQGVDCILLKTGNEAWSPGRGPGDGSAAVTYADRHLYSRYQNGIVALIEATPERFNVKSKFPPASVKAEAWPYPVIAGGNLYLRDQEVLMCYDIKQK